MTLARYITGYMLSLVLTGLSFGAVWLHYYEHHQFPTHEALFACILTLAVLQLVVQLVCFLHAGRGEAARLNLAALALAGVFVFIVVGGSLWIMTSLGARMGASPDQMTQYMQEQDAAM